ncbi:MAG: putative transport system ATP-binding protein [Bacillota bacterium]|nr:ABC transporter ATP-binding protein [Bacillota bacterium]MDK2930040.1 putative transport system ATP-binding protein [Bacillota bacterium]
MALLELEGVRKDYRQGRLTVPALRGIDLEVESGEFMAIAGPSGSGKTTLLNLVGCLDTPTEGVIRLDGIELAKLPKAQLADIRRRRIGFVFQSYNLIPVLTAYENVEFSLALLGENSSNVKDRVMRILADVGLSGLENRRPGDLSGGQQQRVAIARALVKGPDLVLADEPTANLDSETGKAIIELMLEMNQKKGTTFIFSTHDPMVMDYARRLVTVRDGRVAEDKRR